MAFYLRRTVSTWERIVNLSSLRSVFTRLWECFEMIPGSDMKFPFQGGSCSPILAA